MQSTFAWPPPYKLKKHRLARYIKLRVVKPHGLEITMSPRHRLSDVARALEEHKAWIVQQLKALPPVATSLPDQMILHALKQTWRITYLAAASKLKILLRPDQELVLFGKLDEALVKAQLIKWIKQKATLYLITRLREISQVLGLPFSDVTIRSQKSRWGSCSSQKAITLNYKLIFLPPALVDHVIIHELCHTQHLNHSLRFWRLVAKHDANWRTHRQALRQADSYIPDWV